LRITSKPMLHCSLHRQKDIRSQMSEILKVKLAPCPQNWRN